MKKLLMISLLLCTTLTNASAATPTTPDNSNNNKKTPLVDFTKPMLLNYSNQIINVYFYSGAIDPKNAPMVVNENTNLNQYRLGTTIQAGRGVNFPSGTKTVQIFYGLNDPITQSVPDISKSYKIVSSADRWAVIQI